MRGGGPNDVDHELKMDDFDNLKEKLAQIETAVQIDERTQGDHVPTQFKDAFNLPKNMKNLTIDFNEVRLTDA